MAEEKRLTPLKAIRAKCLDCCCWNSYEVKLCAAKKCALYPYRLGKNPYLKPSKAQLEAWNKNLDKINAPTGENSDEAQG